MLRILIVANYNTGYFAPFVVDQTNALKKKHITIDFFGIVGKGIIGYLKNLPALKKKITSFKPDIIHAHYGLSGLLSNLQFRIPVVTTYHGCDINRANFRVLSSIPLIFSAYNIFVSEKQQRNVRWIAKKHTILPCGIDLDFFKPLDKIESQRRLGWTLNKKYVLFSSAFSRPEKNSKLAHKAIKLLPGYELIELKGYSRDYVLLLMSACDVGLLTSVREVSPMFIKEMMACGKPIVSTDVGDVKSLIEGTPGCSIVPLDASAIAHAIKKAIACSSVSYPASSLALMDNDAVAAKLISIYRKI